MAAKKRKSGQRQISGPVEGKVVMYGTLFCPYCMRARKLLKSKHVDFIEIRVDSDRSLRKEMERLSRRDTVPQIFIGQTHVGGYDDLAALNRKGELDSMLVKLNE